MRVLLLALVLTACASPRAAPPPPPAPVAAEPADPSIVPLTVEQERQLSGR